MTARQSLRIVLTAALLAAALAGCGRKAGLDLPPQAQARADGAAAAEEQRDPGPGSVIDQSNRDQLREPTTPRGPKRKFVLDPLLD